MSDNVTTLNAGHNLLKGNQHRALPQTEQQDLKSKTFKYINFRSIQIRKPAVLINL